MRINKQFILLFFILMAALFVRVYRLESVPASLFSDELDMGIQARSLLQTGRDYRNTVSPFYVRSYNADRTPLPIWLTEISTALFNQPELQVRMAPAVEGVGIVLLAFGLIRLLTGNTTAGLLAALVFALSPWQIQFSRIGFEAASLGVVFLGGLLAFFKWVEHKQKRWLYLSTFLLASTVYTYRTMSLFAPLTFLALLIIYFKDIWSLKWRHKICLAGLATVVMGSFLYVTTLASNDQMRINQISIFSDKMVSIWVQRNREVDSGDLSNPIIGNRATLFSKVFHNKPLSWYIAFKDNYLEAVSTQFLFVKGDPDLRQSTGKGLILTLDLIPLIIGGVWLINNRKKNFAKWLLIWLVISPIPSALTTDGGGGHHATRLFLLGIPILFTISLGWWQIWKQVRRYRVGKLFFFGLMLIYLLNFGSYYHYYLVHYPLESAKFFGYGYKQSLEVIKAEARNHHYSGLKLTTTMDPPLPYFWFWNNTPARDIQTRGLNFGGEISGIDSIEAVNWKQMMETEKNPSDLILPDVMYLLTIDDLPTEWREGKLPDGIRLIDKIIYPDQQPIFYLITRDEKDNTPTRRNLR